jgi:nucleoside-diphosphate-sugar epimerase
MEIIIQSAVISGPTGSIGMALIEKLLKENFRILLLVHKGSKKNQNLLNYDKIKIEYIDLDEYSNFNSDLKYDVFFHFAWSGTSGVSRKNYSIQLENLHHSIEAVNLAGRLGCKKFIGAGSQAEFGAHIKKTDPNDVLNPLNYYGAAKASTYFFTKIRCNELGIDHIWFRIYSVFGPYDSPNTLVMSSIDSFLNNKKIDFSAANHNWDFIYSADASNALYLASISNIKDKVYCLGSGVSKPLKDYINIIYNYTNSTSNLVFGQMENKDEHIKYLEANIDHLKRDFNFKPLISFEEGIRKTILWFINNQKK